MSLPLTRLLRKLLHVAAKPIRHSQGKDGCVIHAYRGYGSRSEAFLMGRIFQQPGSRSQLAPGAGRDLMDVARRMLRWGKGGVEVDVSLGDNCTTVTTDRDGYFSVHLPLTSPLVHEGQWQTAQLIARPPKQAAVEGEAQIYLPPASTRLGVISDIDDTVMHTGVANKLKMLYRLFIESAERRMAFPGVAALYQALHEGPDGQQQRPLLYVSRGPWSIYEMLEIFFQHNRIPVGPILFLREWGLTLQRPLPKRSEDHKQALIEKMLDLYDEMQFLLIGDSGQHDPEVYADVVRRYPGRICAIYIRQIGDSDSRKAELATLSEELSVLGCDMLLSTDSLDMARHAYANDYIDAASVEMVRAEIEHQYSDVAA
ncbi:App1 family protein [Cobetia crustatorum]|uniref:App1 family protein n=1 Tax=Cobetia crustatorum TaxID=553385 RepID=UPI00046A668C|nr:phosphatase domain-containing protein [Cobetia crustatorum]